MVFWIGSIIFAIASMMFAVLENRRNVRKMVFRSHIFVSFITTISYVIMVLALATGVANGQPIYWTRWLFYMASCSILTLDIAFIAKIPDVRKVEVTIFTGLTMFCSFLATIIVSVDRWWFFGLSSVAYIIMLYILFKRYDGSSMSMSSVIWFVVITWSLFPVIWVLAPTGIGFFTTDIEAILYLALDFITKITFGVYITTRKRLIE